MALWAFRVPVSELVEAAALDRTSARDEADARKQYSQNVLISELFAFDKFMSPTFILSCGPASAHNLDLDGISSDAIVPCQSSCTWNTESLVQLLPKTNLIGRGAPVIWRPFKSWTSLLCGQVTLRLLGRIYKRPVYLGCELRLRA